MAHLFSNTAAELVELTARILKDWKGGTCTGGGASTFIDTARTEPDDYFQNTVPVSRVRVWSTTDGAAPQGQERTISDWVNSTGTGTVSAAWTTSNPASGDKYAILSEYSWEEIYHALNDALASLKDKAVIERSDESTVIVDSVYEYPIPAGFTHIYRATMADSAGTFGQPIPPTEYLIVRGTSTPRLQLKRFPWLEVPDGWFYSGHWADDWLEAGRAVRIEGYGFQSPLLTDLDLCYLDPTFVTNQAAAYLHARRIRRMDTEPTGHQAQYQVCQAQADAAKPRTITNFPPNTKRVY